MTIKNALSPDMTVCDSVTNVSNVKVEHSLRPGESLIGSKTGKDVRSPSARGGGAAISSKDTIVSEKLYNKDGEEICRHVNFVLFKSIYGHGLEVKFVKLLFLLLKRQVGKFIEHKNLLAKNNIAANKRKQVKIKEVSSVSVGKIGDSDRNTYKRP